MNNLLIQQLHTLVSAQGEKGSDHLSPNKDIIVLGLMFPVLYFSLCD